MKKAVRACFDGEAGRRFFGENVKKASEKQSALATGVLPNGEAFRPTFPLFLLRSKGAAFCLLAPVSCLQWKGRSVHISTGKWAAVFPSMSEWK